MHTALLLVELGVAVAFLVLITRALLARAGELGLRPGDPALNAGPDRLP